MIVQEGAGAIVALIDAAVMWARIIAASAALVLCVIAFAIGPLLAPAAETVRRRARPAWARGTAQARRIARRTRRDYDEAA